jgi:heat-inducible transcriptional repressor
MTPKRGRRFAISPRLSERRVLLIINSPEGDVQNRILHRSFVFAAQLIRATNFFNRHYAGQPFNASRASRTS